MPYLHIENSTRSSALSHVTPDHIQSARIRHPDLADLVVTIGWDGDILDRCLATADYLIASKPPRENLRIQAPKLRWIQTTGAGVDHLMPLDWLPESITLTNNSGPHGPRCEDFCTMALLALWQQIPRFVYQQSKRFWDSVYTTPIAGNKCLVLGYGDIGQAAARAAKKLGLYTIAVTRTGKGQGPADSVVSTAALDEVLPLADFLIVATPLTEETRNLVNRARLAKMKRGAGLINVARAAIVDYTALVEMLEAGELAGAILDVHSPEPLPEGSPLWGTRNLLLTPHISCDDPRYVDMLLDAWMRNWARLENGEPLRNVVDRQRGY
jgi:phosphoglycerate dehydrogenase-like enzyme